MCCEFCLSKSDETLHCNNLNQLYVAQVRVYYSRNCKGELWACFANRQLPFPIGERKKVVVVSEDGNKQLDPSLGASVMSVSALTKQAETGDLSMDAIFTTPDLISKLVPIAPVSFVE